MFLVCGEALFDVFASGDTPTGVAFDGRVGGSPFNVAIGLARLSQPVSFFSGVSKGFLGERLMRTLAEERVGTATVQRLDAPTTLSLIGLDAAGVPSYSFYGEGAADRVLGADALALVPDGVTALQLGSYATVVEPVASTQRALVEKLQKTAFIAYDPNIRLNVEPDLGPWRAMVDWMQPRCGMLKVSDEDLGLLYPGRALDDFAQGALAAGSALVVVTRGSKGAIGWTRGGQRVEAAPVAVKVVDTVGAGDTFQAALLTWLAEQAKLTREAAGALTAAQLGEALAFAARAAAITCSRRGADLPRRSEV